MGALWKWCEATLADSWLWLTGLLGGNTRLATALSERGNALRDSQRAHDALPLYDRALQLNPGVADTHYNRGLALQYLEQPDEAVTCYDRALAINPAHPRALYRRGNALLGLNRADEAVASYDRALQLTPDYADALYNRGLALQRLQRAIEAVASYDRALAIKPDDAEACNNRGNALLDLRRPADALASYDHAIAIKPDYANAHTNRGNALRDLQRPLDALASYDRALALNPGHADAHYNRGHALADTGQREAAIIAYEQAVKISPEHLEARWSLVMAIIPKLPVAGEHFAASRQAFARGLIELDTYFETRQLDGGHIVGTATPFYLAYQEKNNRELLAAYGRLCAKLMHRWQSRQPLPKHAPAATGRPLRIGIVSAHVRTHSVWNAIVKGWLQQLDRQTFEIHVFCLSAGQDDETAWAKSSAHAFEHGDKDLREWVATILRGQLAVLIYPEIGMDPLTVKLASLRLAPVQVVAWGHPETTGLPTVDYYLSAADFEPPEPQQNYTEKLVALPHLGVYYTPPAVISHEPDLAALGIRPDVPMFICAGTPFKYAPHYDFIFVAIARRLGQCQFVFFTSEAGAMSEKLGARLAAAFSTAGLRFADYGVFVPWQSAAGFHGLMKRADVFLDTLEFSGFNTAMQAVECNLPIVAKDGLFMRGRLASGILRRLGIHELIAGEIDDYINLAVRLAENPDYRRHIRQRMQAARVVLYEDVAPVRALEQALVEMAALAEPL